MIHLGFTLYAIIHALQVFNLNPSADFIAWSNSVFFLPYLIIGIASPLILMLKTQLVLQLRYIIYIMILLQLYPLMVYGVGFSNAIFLASILYPLLLDIKQSSP